MATGTGISNYEAATTVFAGQGDLVIFDPVSDYANVAFSDLDNPKSLGQIVQDSTSWEGEDPETTTINDEQGNIITARVAAGTLGFSFEIASTSKAMVKKFLNGADVVIDGNSNFDANVTAVGFGVELPVITVPIMILNDERKRSWLYPKAKITSALTYADGLWRIKASVICEWLDTPTLKTGMLLEGAPKYKA